MGSTELLFSRMTLSQSGFHVACSASRERRGDPRNVGPCLRTLIVSGRPLLMSARPLLVTAPWMPAVPLLLSLSPVLLCHRARLPSTRIKTGGGRKCTITGIMQVYSRILLRPTPPQQPTGLLQLWPRALRAATPWSLGLLDSDIPNLRRQLVRLTGKRFVCNTTVSGWTGCPGTGGLLDVLAPHSTTTAPHKTTPAAYSFLATGGDHGRLDRPPGDRCPTGDQKGWLQLKCLCLFSGGISRLGSLRT